MTPKTFPNTLHSGVAADFQADVEKRREEVSDHFRLLVGPDHTVDVRVEVLAHFIAATLHAEAMRGFLVNVAGASPEWLKKVEEHERRAGVHAAGVAACDEVRDAWKLADEMMSRRTR